MMGRPTPIRSHHSLRTNVKVQRKTTVRLQTVSKIYTATLVRTSSRLSLLSKLKGSLELTRTAQRLQLRRPGTW